MEGLKTVLLAARVEPRVAQELRDWAWAKRTSVSAILRRHIEQELAERQADPPPRKEAER